MMMMMVMMIMMMMKIIVVVMMMIIDDHVRGDCDHLGLRAYGADGNDAGDDDHVQEDD